MRNGLLQPLASRRRGFTMLELVVAVVVLGITLGGLFPLIVMQYRTFQRLVVQVGAQDADYYRTSHTGSGVNWEMKELYISPYTYIMVPPPDWVPWARKLGAGAMTTMTALSSSYKPPIADPIDFTIDSAKLVSPYYVLNNAEGTWDGNRHLAVTINVNHATSANWTFTNVPIGYYYLQAQWTGNADQATATYTICVNGTAATAIATGTQTTSTTGWQRLTIGTNDLFLVQQNSDVVVFLDALLEDPDVGKYVAAGVLRLVPKNTVKINYTTGSVSTLSCTQSANGWTAEVNTTVTSNFNKTD